MSVQGQSQPISLDSPIDGWNAFHSLDNMPPTAAIILDNIVPGAGRCDTRAGYIEYADVGTSFPVETVASLDSETESRLLAASNGGLWDITNPAAVLAREVGAQAVDNVQPESTFTSSRWQHANFRKLDETGVLILCNGVDNAQVWEAPWTTTRDLIDTDVVGIDFIGCLTYKGRMYYWKDNDNAFYYANAGSYEGNLSKFDLGSFTQRGGKLVQVVTWTQQDSGDGKDDFIVFIFSTGEILVYQGDDPDTLWEQVGRFKAAAPLSIRGHDQFGADRIVMTKDGYVSLATIIQQGRTSDVSAFSMLIHNAIKERTDSREQLYGWDCTLYPRNGLFIFNVPLSEETFEQHVLNTVTMRWCRFKGFNVNCIEVHNERLFGGAADGKVHALLEGTSDKGSPIDFTCLYAFQYLENPGVQKQVNAAQIISTHPQPQNIQLTGYADFDVPVITPVDLPLSQSIATWSIDPAVPAQPAGSFWDEDYWSVASNPVTTKGWQNVSAFGYAVSLLVRFALVNESIVWRSTGIRFINAGAQ